MTRPAISVENLSKVYRIGLKETRPDTLVGAVQRLVAAPLANYRRLSRLNTFKNLDEADDTFWALRDVSFDIAEGEVVGIIGRNGAGKSTLLKILSRITEPTSGRAVIRGRVSSLLEVGTGFHQELTGRENVYMNGTILGMTKREIDRKFDAIVDFSGVEKFLDTPIKYYSSGMKVRLAFSVAAHLEPEILIIDEVLAVGDAEFQKKCIGKMKDVAAGGRTVLFVSHNMAAVDHLCSRGILLRSGQTLHDGSAQHAIELYVNSGDEASDHNPDLRSHPARWNNCQAVLREIKFLDRHGKERTRYSTGEDVIIELRILPTTVVRKPHVGIGIDDSMGVRLFSAATYLSPHRLDEFTGESRVRCHLESVPLIAGRYYLSLSVQDGTDVVLDAIDHAVALDFDDSNYLGNGRPQSAIFGRIAMQSSWSQVSND